MTKLLVVDDSQQNLYMLQVLLSTNGFEVELASNGAEALERARRTPPNMIISDILMPVMDGFTLCRAWKEDERLQQIPFVFYTATYTDPRDEDFALSLGATRFIIKPAEPDKFLALLRETIAAHEAGKLAAPRQPIAEAQYYKEYNVALIRKLEDKVRQLEEANRALERDIVERKLAEEALTYERNLLRALMDNTPDHIYFKDSDSRFIRINKAQADVFGISDPTQAIGKTDFDFFTEQHARPAYENEQEIMKTGRPLVNVEEKETWPDGRVTWVSTTKVPLRDLNGQIIGTFGISRDIAERKRTEEALRASEDKFKYVFDHSIIGKSITQPSGEISVNQAFCEMLGYTPEELRNQKWQDITHPDDMELTQRVVDALLVGEQASVRFSKRYLHKNGSVVWADVSSSLRRDQEGKPLYFMTTVSDITERKRADAERERLMTELAWKNNELEQLVYVTSHDLRSPLVNVHGFSQELRHAVQDLAALLQSPEVPEHLRKKAAALVENDLQEDLHYILISIAKMDVLLSGLLKLSRLGRIVLTITTLDLNTLIANVLTTFEFHIQAAGVKLEVGELPSCTGDATQIYQVFSNLLDNALKYRDPNRTGVIKIWGSQAADQSIYCIEDNGIGIAPEYHPKIFEIFHRLNPNQIPGEGLGLTIARRILERQGGKIWMESEPGKGSKFYVELPGGERNSTSPRPLSKGEGRLPPLRGGQGRGDKE
jgi:chemotaxis family two-component system sensor kinase Cph1